MKRLLLTAGPTREHLDPVRYLTNGSSGKMGYALAAEAVARGWSVDLVSGPVGLAAPAGVTVHRVVSADDMLAACRPLFTACDCFIAVAAVADYRPSERLHEKVKKSADGLTLRLVPTVDVLRSLAATRRAGQTVVGFAAETHDVEARAEQKLRDKSCDWMVANDVSRLGLGMDADDNAVVILGRGGQRHAFGPAPKSAVAAFILDHVTGMRKLGPEVHA